jgi:hypothetical protein
MSIGVNAGALEQIRHALEHAKLMHESDRRHALISIDNAIELIVRAWINRHKQLKEAIDKASTSPSAASQEYLKRCAIEMRKVQPTVDYVAILRVHGLRNELYHKGQPLYPDRSTIEIALEQCRALYAGVFNHDPLERLFTTGISAVAVAEQVEFLSEVQTLTRIIVSLCDVADGAEKELTDDQLLQEWRIFASLQGAEFIARTEDLNDVLAVRRKLIIHGLSAIGDVEIRQITKATRRLAAFIDGYSHRASILYRTALKFPWLPLCDKLADLQLFMKSGSFFVAATFSDGSIKEEDLDYIIATKVVTESIRVKAVWESDEDGGGENTVLLPVKTVQAKPFLFGVRDLRTALATLFACDPMTIAVALSYAVDEARQIDIPEDDSVSPYRDLLPGVNGATVQYEILDPLVYNPTSFLHHQFGPSDAN